MKFLSDLRQSYGVGAAKLGDFARLEFV